MIIQFNNIRLNNFMSFEDETVQLDNLGYTLVSGKNEAVGDSALSNGSGKSSIWEGIVWALTGETIRGNKNVVNIFGNDGAVVCLDFNVDDKLRMKNKGVKETDVADYFKEISKMSKETSDLWKQIDAYVNTMGLNEWGYFCILRSLSEHIF